MEDFISLDDNILYANKGFESALCSVVPEFDLFGETEISREQWIEIDRIIPKDDQNSMESYLEADQWLRDVFENYGCFTSLGL